MDPITGALLMGGLTMGVGALAGHSANKANIDAVRETNRQNYLINQEQMAFQEGLSSSAYQRAMKDMKLAGLNPMLAYSQGGASTPGGASGQMQTAKRANWMGDALSTGVASAKAAGDLGNAMNAQNSQKALNDANIMTQVSTREAQVASAESSRAAAEKARAEAATARAELAGRAEKSKLDAEEARYRREWAKEKDWSDRIQTGLGIGNSAKSLITPPAISWKHDPRDSGARMDRKGEIYKNPRRPF